jgi:hypothetical protein
MPEERDAGSFLGSVSGSSLTSRFGTRVKVATDEELAGLVREDGDLEDDLEDNDTEAILLGSHICAGGRSWRPHHGRRISGSGISLGDEG